MAFINQAVSSLLFVIVCILHSDAQSVPDRCRCPVTSSKAFRWKNIEEFSVTAPRSRCKDTEIILTLKIVNGKKNEKRCISPIIYQGEHLQECWIRINKDGKRSTIKMSECGMSRNTVIKTENTTTISSTSGQSS